MCQCICTGDKALSKFRQVIHNLGKSAPGHLPEGKEQPRESVKPSSSEKTSIELQFEVEDVGVPERRDLGPQSNNPLTIVQILDSCCRPDSEYAGMERREGPNSKKILGT